MGATVTFTLPEIVQPGACVVVDAGFAVVFGARVVFGGGAVVVFGGGAVVFGGGAAVVFGGGAAVVFAGGAAVALAAVAFDAAVVFGAAAVALAAGRGGAGAVPFVVAVPLPPSGPGRLANPPRSDTKSCSIAFSMRERSRGPSSMAKSEDDAREFGISDRMSLRCPCMTSPSCTMVA